MDAAIPQGIPRECAGVTGLVFRNQYWRVFRRSSNENHAYAKAAWISILKRKRSIKPDGLRVYATMDWFIYTAKNHRRRAVLPMVLFAIRKLKGQFNDKNCSLSGIASSRLKEAVVG